jgi:hypothetical protein
VVNRQCAHRARTAICRVQDVAPEGRLRLLRGNDADVGHHAAVLVLANVAVVDEVADFSKRNAHRHRCDGAGSGAPGGDAAIAVVSTRGQSHEEQQDIDDCADEGGEWNGNDCSCSVGSPGGGGGGGCVRPTSEASSAVGRWLVTITAFQQSVIAIGNPSGLMVHESSPYPGINGCWYTGAPFDPTSTVSGGEWTIGGWDPNPLLLSINGPYQWGSDVDGDTPALIGTIRAHAALPCTDNIPQTMASQTSCNLGSYNTYFFNTQTVTITSAAVTNCRAGVCDTINY